MSDYDGFENKGGYRPNQDNSGGSNYNGSSGGNGYGNNGGNSGGGYSGNNSGNDQGGNSNWKQNNGGGNSNWKQNNGGGNSNWKQNNGGNNWKGKGGGNWKKKNEEPLDPSKVFLYRAFAVSGDKNTPPEVVERMMSVIRRLEPFHYTVRTTGLKGPDNVVEREVRDAEVYLPWNGFDDKKTKFYYNTEECLIIAKQFHPAFDGLKPAIHAFLGCNVRLILGNNVKSPVRFMLTFTEDGAETTAQKSAKTGNLGLPISIATAMRIPVFNFYHPEAEDRLYAFLNLDGDHYNGQEQQR